LFHIAEVKPDRNTSDLIRLASFATAVGFGFGAASIQALRKTSGGLSFEFSAMTGVAFVIGAAIAIGFWRLLATSLNSDKPNTKALRAAVAGLIVMAVAGFLYPLRFVAEEKYADLWIGLGLAVMVLALVGTVFWHLVRLLNKDAERN
jgi:hypothetical protein